MIIRRRRVFVIFMIVIWLLGIIYFISDSGFLRNDPPKVGNYVIFLVDKTHSVRGGECYAPWGNGIKDYLTRIMI